MQRSLHAPASPAQVLWEVGAKRWRRSQFIYCSLNLESVATPDMVKLFSILLLLGVCAAPAELTWENPSQEFQRQPQDKDLVVNFAFRNDGKTPVTITKTNSSCGCTTAELPKKTYLPGERGNLTAKFTFGGRSGLQSKSISVVTDDQQTAQLVFKCLILDEPVALSQSLVWWRVGETAEAKNIEIAVAKQPAIKITAAASTNPRIVAILSTVKDGEKYVVSVKPADTAQPENGEIFVQTDYPPEGPKAYTIHVRVK